MFGDDAAVAHGAGFAVNCEDPVAEHERLVRQTYARWVRVDAGGVRPEHFSNRTDSIFHAGSAVMQGLRVFKLLVHGECLRRVIVWQLQAVPGQWVALVLRREPVELAAAALLVARGLPRPLVLR